MGFKLVRVDATESCKVTLPLGSHFIGRGKFLDCNDNRVSRKHAELTVTADTILLKSLHQNPCFFKKKLSNETIIFCQPDSHILSNGDQFGLVPDSYWYEVIYCLEDSPTNITENILTNDETVEQKDNVEREMALTEKNNEDTEPFDKDKETIDYFSDSLPSERTESLSLIPAQNPSPKEYEDDCAMLLADCPEGVKTISTDHQNESTDQSNDSTDQCNKSKDPLDESAIQSDESAYQPDESTDQSDELTIDQPDESTDQADESTDQGTNANKRTHSQEGSPCDIKKVKTEPEPSSTKKTEDGPSSHLNPGVGGSTTVHLVKTEPGSPQDVKPGPSNNQGGSSNDGNSNAPPLPQAPTKPPNIPLRERCMYGANCYRRNIQHKSTYSHPTDPDWGPGEQAPCPWGAACRRADPRHRRDHAHPPGAQPPPRAAAGVRPGKRRRRQRSVTPDSNSGEESEDTSLIVSGKRARKPIVRQGWSDSEDDEDPYKTDETDEWEPPSQVASQDFSQSQD